MTVSELITALQGMPGDALVLMSEECGYSTPTAVRRDECSRKAEGCNGGWMGAFDAGWTAGDDTMPCVVLDAESKT